MGYDPKVEAAAINAQATMYAADQQREGAIATAGAKVKAADTKASSEKWSAGVGAAAGLVTTWMSNNTQMNAAMMARQDPAAVDPAYVAAMGMERDPRTRGTG